MKRMLIALSVVVASAAFAAPASAQTASSDANWAPCGSTPLVQCLKEALDVSVNAKVCQTGETVDECAERLARWAADQLDPQALITLVFQQVDYAGYLANWAIETAEYYCGQVIRTCDDGDMPLIP